MMTQKFQKVPLYEARFFKVSPCGGLGWGKGIRGVTEEEYLAAKGTKKEVSYFDNREDAEEEAFKRYAARTEWRKPAPQYRGL